MPVVSFTRGWLVDLYERLILIVLSSQQISGLHSRIKNDPSDWIILDRQNSFHGDCVGGARIMIDSRLLRHKQLRRRGVNGIYCSAFDVGVLV